MRGLERHLYERIVCKASVKSISCYSPVATYSSRVQDSSSTMSCCDEDYKFRTALNVVLPEPHSSDNAESRHQKTPWLLHKALKNHERFR